MKTKSVGFIGGGRVTRIILQAFKNKNTHFSKILVTDPDKVVTGNLRKSFPEIQVDTALTAASCDIVFISLHPPMIMDTLELIKDSIHNNTIVISLAPKITISRIESKLTNPKNIARLIPNATSYINEGYNPVCFAPGFEPGDKAEILELLGLLGFTFEAAEEKLESYAIMSAMLPTYFWFQWRELAEIGQKIGLTEKESMGSIKDTLIASINLMYKSGLTSAEVIDLIPVKPIGQNESEISEIYQTRLTALFDKIKP
jgi:pyrroline-5-carboxylate reductase